MSDIKPTVPEAIDKLESYLEDGRYSDQLLIRPSIQTILDELTRVQTELNRAAGEIVVLREQVKREVDKVRKCDGCRFPLYPNQTVCPCCGAYKAEYQLTQ